MNATGQNTNRKEPHLDDAVHSVVDMFPKRSDLGDMPDWDVVIEVLAIEHRCISALLDTLETLALNLDKGKIPDYHLLLDVLDYLKHYPDHYHHPREDYIFSALLSRNHSIDTKIDRLTREHRTLHEENDALFNEFTRIVAGRPANRPQILERLTGYIHLYREHMDFENSEIFPMAQGTLSPGDWAQVREKTLYIDDPLFGDTILRKFARLTRRLRAEYAMMLK
jgi:hemerythrin-like domain-containing protein